jgi:hypothetical protein
LEHHDEYDSRTSQSKGVTIGELCGHRDDLYAYNARARAALDASAPPPTLSRAAIEIARWLNEASTLGFHLDSQVRVDALPGMLGTTADDVEMAADELIDAGLVEHNGSGDILLATNRLFWETDPMFRESDPATDAPHVARVVVAHEHDFPDMKDIATSLGWSPRRLNPAATYLIAAGIVDERPALGSAPFACLSLIKTAKTRRFVRDNSDSAA